MASSTLGPETGESGSGDFDDVDDYDGFRYLLQESDKAAGYKLDYNVSVDVAYYNNDLSGVKSGQTTEVKWVTVEVNETVIGSKVVLKAFFCNIGGTRYLTRYVP